MTDVNSFINQEMRRLNSERESLEQRLTEIQTILKYLSNQSWSTNREAALTETHLPPSRRSRKNIPTVKSLVEDYFRKTEEFSRPELAKYVLGVRPEVSEASVGAQLGESYRDKLVERIGPGTYKSNIFQKEEVYEPGPEFGKLTGRF